MDKGKMNRVTIGITVMILLAVFLFLGYPLLNLDREEIVLPGENSASDISDPGEGAGGGNAVQRVEDGRPCGGYTDAAGILFPHHDADYVLERRQRYDYSRKCRQR